MSEKYLPAASIVSEYSLQKIFRYLLSLQYSVQLIQLIVLL